MSTPELLASKILICLANIPRYVVEKKSIWGPSTFGRDIFDWICSDIGARVMIHMYHVWYVSSPSYLPWKSDDCRHVELQSQKDIRSCRRLETVKIDFNQEAAWLLQG